MTSMDSPWEEDPQADYAPKADWAKLSNEFTNVRGAALYLFIIPFIDISIYSLGIEKA